MELSRYSLDWSTAGDAGVERAFRFLLELHSAELDHALVDAVTGEIDLTEPAARALEELVKLGEYQAKVRRPRVGRGILASLRDDPAIAVELDLKDRDHFRLFHDFALFSTAAVLYLEGDDDPEIEIYDIGKSFTFFGDESFVEELAERAKIPPESCVNVSG